MKQSFSSQASLKTRNGEAFESSQDSEAALIKQAAEQKNGVDATHIKAQFTAFLRQKKYRNTQERYLVLDSILEFDHHFSADELYLAMRSAGVQVSRATIYSTLDLLTRCNILMKHRFQGDSAHFELADKMPNHDHLICIECGRIVEFQEEALHTIEERVAAEHGFKSLRHSLQVFVVCNDIRNCDYNKV
jgi:Fur family transcriptional regulator, ferric uptake regulator